MSMDRTVLYRIVMDTLQRKGSLQDRGGVSGQLQLREPELL